MEAQFYLTRRLNSRVAASQEVAQAVTDAITRFSSLDWGELPQEDKEANARDLKATGGHILGRYNTPDGPVYVEWYVGDGEPAVICFCDER